MAQARPAAHLLGAAPGRDPHCRDRQCRDHREPLPQSARAIVATSRGTGLCHAGTGFAKRSAAGCKRIRTRTRRSVRPGGSGCLFRLWTDSSALAAESAAAGATGSTRSIRPACGVARCVADGVRGTRCPNICTRCCGRPAYDYIGAGECDPDRSTGDRSARTAGTAGLSGCADAPGDAARDSIRVSHQSRERQRSV